MNDQTISSEFLENYQTFCANPLRGKVQIEEELYALQKVPGVRQIAFAKRADVLIVGTDPVKIKHPKEDVRAPVYLIGTFLIYLIRRREGRVWYADFRLKNVSHVINKCNMICMHPHMRIQSDVELQTTVADICISSGRFHIYEHIRRGEMHHAIRSIIDLLHSLGPNTPYLSVDNWPTVEEKHGWQ